MAEPEVNKEEAQESFEEFVSRELRKAPRESSAPRPDFLKSEQVRRLSETQKAARDRLSNLLLLVPSSVKVDK